MAKQKRKDKQYSSSFQAPEFKPLNDKQAAYFRAIQKNDVIVGAGSAGTGKTMIPASLAADMYNLGMYDQIIITRPTVACGEDLGALPGTLAEKFDPWTRQVTNYIIKRLGKGKFDCDYGKRIHCLPLQFMRGETFDNAFIIVDEAQNLTKEQVMMIVTRIGINSKIVLCGDTNQTDINNASGLAYFINLLKRKDKSIPIIEFTLDDCVRSDICKRMLKLFED